MDGEVKPLGTLTGNITGTGTLTGSLAGNGLEGQLTVPANLGGFTSYEQLDNKPSIEDVTLVGNKTFEELGLESIDNSELMGLLTL